MNHKRECKIFKEVNDLKTNRNWESWAFKQPLAIGFNDVPPEVKTTQERPYVFDPKWRDVNSAKVQDLQGTFVIKSGATIISHCCIALTLTLAGEIVWGHLPCILMGMKTNAHDTPTVVDNTAAGSTIMTQGWTYRVPARPGIWKVRFSLVQLLHDFLTIIIDRKSKRVWKPSISS